MASGVRNQRGNMRMGVFDKLIVPLNDYWLPGTTAGRSRCEEPIVEVGKPVIINKVHVHEISKTYEGNPMNPQMNFHEFAFTEIVGNPITEESLEQGYELVTSQGETLIIKWIQNSAWYERGLLIYVANANAQVYYDPNWGNIAAVGIEWQTVDGEQSGTNWANRIGGYVQADDLYNSADYGDIIWNLYWGSYTYTCGKNKYGTTQKCTGWKLFDRGKYNAPDSIRAEAMCGDPMDRTIGRLGNKLPIRVYPAIGDVGTGLVYMFNSNVLKYVEVEETAATPVDTDPTTSLEPSSDIGFFCDGSVSASEVNTDYWTGSTAWNSTTQGAVQAQLGETLDSKFWLARNQLLALFDNDSAPVSKSQENIGDFHRYLWKALKDAQSGDLNLPVDTWEAFDIWCENNVSCLSSLHRGMIYYTVKTKIPTIVKESAAGYLSGVTPDIMCEYITKLPRTPVDWFDFNDIKEDPAGALIGAFAADMYIEAYPDILKSFRSFVNFEPSALLYGEGAAIASDPHDFVKPSGVEWGTAVSHTLVDWSAYVTERFTEGDSDTRSAIVAAEVAIHEFGHAVDYYGRDLNGELFTEKQAWLDLGGWGEHFGGTGDVSQHLIKSRTAAETDGMPKTDDDKEPAVTDYGCMSPMEDFAEAFRVYIFNPSFLKEKFPGRHNFMETYIKPLI